MAKPRPPKLKMAKKRGGSGGKPRPAGTLRGWLRAIGRSLVAGSVLGSLLVAAVLWRWALARVDEGLDGPVWTVPGRVMSAPLAVWPGETLTPEQLATDLAAAGYARVPRAAQPGDFQVTSDAVHLVLKADRGVGWSVRAGEALVTFAGGRVKSVSPGSQLDLPPATIAVVRGTDNENRSPVELARIPKHMVQAVLAIEDSRFYDHGGVDPVGILRAMVRNATAGAMRQGGSTLTQQLVKNVFLSHEKTAARKGKEALLALAVEKRLSKDEILTMYLNEIYLGQSGGSSVCGVDAAARAFFAKPIERVSVAEAATLAGIIQSPNPYNPVRHPEAATERRNVVLARMVELGFLEQAAADAAKAAPVKPHARSEGRVSPWAVDLAVEEAEAGDEGRVAREALTVQTTIQPQVQRLAERAVEEGLAEVLSAHPKLADVQAAMVVVRARDGAIVAMVGGRNYSESAFNRVVNSPREVGSTVKALTMLAAFEVDPGLSGATIVNDAPLSRAVDGKTWTPANYDGAFLGPLPLRDAIAKSRNLPAVELAERVGLASLQTRLKGLGLTRATAFPSVSLGGFSATPAELAGAYTVFAADGAYHAPYLLRSVTQDSTVVADHAPKKAGLRYSPTATFLAYDVLHSVLTEGTGKSAAKYGVGLGAAGKTGTTDDYGDAWFAGVTGPYSVVMWVGFDTPKPLGLTGGQAALPAWARLVDSLGFDAKPKAAPGGLELAEVCVATGAPPCGSCEATRSEWFVSGRVPPAECGAIPEAVEAIRTGWKSIGELLGLGGGDRP